jgi:hypothetical protein
MIANLFCVAGYSRRIWLRHMLHCFTRCCSSLRQEQLETSQTDDLRATSSTSADVWVPYVQKAVLYIGKYLLIPDEKKWILEALKWHSRQQINKTGTTVKLELLFLADFPKSGLLDLCPVCVSVYPTHQLLNASINLYETWCVCHGNWFRLNGVLHKSLPSICVSVCVSPIVAR